MLDTILQKIMDFLGQVDPATVKDGLNKAGDLAGKAVQSAGGSDFLNGIWNQYYYLIIGVVAAFIIWHLISLPFKFVVNGLIGCAMLMGVNWVAGLINVTPVPINIFTALVAGIVGIPGVVAIIIYYVFIH